MKVIVKGVGPITLTQKEFLASGGEGNIYAKNGVAYKIYDDPKKMIPVAKIQELSVLDKPNIIRPELLILDEKNNPIGHTMKFVKNTYALCQLFTKAFKQRNNVSHETSIKLVKILQDTIEYIHSKRILVVDLNELNFLCSDKFDDIYAIDVNSYQTKSFPATAIMDSIRDRHAKKFEEATDWFSWGIVAFQLLIGIHPYKGHHKQFENLPLDQRLDARMFKNVSVFNTEATIPKVCFPFDVIPNALKQWFIAVFEHGKRVLPPKDYEEIVHIVTTKIQEIVGSNLFDVKELLELKEEIIEVQFYAGNGVIITPNKVHVGKKEYALPFPNAKVVLTPVFGKPIAAGLVAGKLKLWDMDGNKEITNMSNAEHIMEYNGNFYIQNNQNITEVSFLEISQSNIQPATKIVANVIDAPETTKVFAGTVCQNLLGRYVFSLFPTPGFCYQLSVPELDGYKIIDAKFLSKVLVVIGVKKGQYDRFVLKIDDNFKSYELRKIENITYIGINFTVNDAGICTLLNEDEKLEAFSEKHGHSTLKIIDDSILDGSMKLFHDGTRILVAKGKKLYSISMKKP